MPSTTKMQRCQCLQVIEQVLSDGEVHEAQEIYEACESAGFAISTVRNMLVRMQYENAVVRRPLITYRLLKKEPGRG